ncbi:MAG: hypothetical protein ACTSUF_10345 [Candidatus Heimdallarchaeaceae archaeon]
MKEYWENFYKKKHITYPSSFAKFCSRYIQKDWYLLDLGCGNGRDSYYLGKYAYEVRGCDYACLPKHKDNVTFVKRDFELMLKNIPFYEVIYARFFIHSISDRQISKLLDKVSLYLMLEFRCKEDIPKLYKHERNLIDSDKLLKKLLNKNYEIKFFQKDTGLSKFKGEDPVIGRIICQKKH